MQLAAGILIGVLMHLYTSAIGRLPRRHVIPVTQSVIVAVLVLFSGLLRTDAVWVTVAFYFVGLVLGLLLISQFWTLANNLYDARQAKRLFGPIGAGSSLGGALGAQVTATVVQQVGSDNLLLIAAAILGVCIVIVRAIEKRHAVGGMVDFAGEERGVRGGEAIALMRESKQLRVIALVVGFSAAGAWIIEQQLNMAAEATRGDAGGDAIAAFLAQVNALMSLSGFVVQVALTSRIHRSMGLAFALLLLPVSFAATAIVILTSGALWAPAVARGLDTTLRHTVDKTTRELLFLPLAAELKHRAKPFIDVTMDRVARALAALLVLVLIKPWGLGLDWRGLSYASSDDDRALDRDGPGRAPRLPGVVSRQHRRADDRARADPDRRRRRGDDRGPGRRPVESRGRGRPLRDRHAAGARPAAPDHAAAAAHESPRVRARTLQRSPPPAPASPSAGPERSSE